MENAGPADTAAAAPDAAVTGAPDAAAATEAPAGSSGPVWHFLITPRWLSWHLLMVVSFLGMRWLGDWQFHRALAGNGLSWAYTFEWPLFAVFAVVFWAKTIRDEFRIRRGEMPDPRAFADAEDLPAGGRRPRAGQQRAGQRVQASSVQASSVQVRAVQAGPAGRRG